MHESCRRPATENAAGSGAYPTDTKRVTATALRRCRETGLHNQLMSPKKYRNSAAKCRYLINQITRNTRQAIIEELYPAMVDKTSQTLWRGLRVPLYTAIVTFAVFTPIAFCAPDMAFLFDIVFVLL